MAPLVSVVMPVCNAERYVRDAASSILSQTHSDFEFIVIDDGSADRTTQILKGYADRRLVLIERPHRGVVVSLNEGIALARGQYVAIMHGDDIAFPTRLEKQSAFLAGHPTIGILGTAGLLIDADSIGHGVHAPPRDDLQIRWLSLLTNPMIHPTVMLRRSVLCENRLAYREGFLAVEDYDLFTRVLAYTRAANLHEPLLRYRLHDQSATSEHREAQLRSQDMVALRTIQDRAPGLSVTLQQVGQLRSLFVQNMLVSAEARGRLTLCELYLDMLSAFASRRPTEPGLGTLRRQEAARVGSVALRCLMRPGGPHLARRLMALNPLLPVSMLADQAVVSGRAIKRKMKMDLRVVPDVTSPG